MEAVVTTSRRRKSKGPEVWGFGGFENEAAIKWVETLEEAMDLELIEAALDEVLELDEEGEVPGATESTQALAAAETVATLVGHPPSTLPEEVRQWCFDHPGLDLGDVQPKAVQALGVLLQDSWLQELFEERGELEEWEVELEGLRDRLRA